MSYKKELTMSPNTQNLNNNQEDSLFSYFFSKDGFLGRGDFLGIIVLCHLFLQFAMKQSLILNDIIYCLAFYILSVAIQKRCQDIQWKGTFFLLLFFITFPLLNYYQYMKINDILIPSQLKNILAIFGSIYFFCHCLLLFIPGKKIKDKQINSKFLKYPYVYMSFGIILFLVGQYFLSIYNF